MKKWIFFGLVFFACTSFRNIGVDLNEIRTLYKESVNSKKACEKLIEISVSDETNSSLISGYKGCATIIMAKYFSNPFTKMSHFKNGKNILEKAIGADENNIELRFLRFTVQTSTPAFLGYNHNLEMDKNFILKFFHQIKDEKLKHFMMPFLKKSKYLSSEEKLQLI